MNRWIWLWICAIVGLVMLVLGWLLPAHLRAADASVIERAGRNTQSLVAEGLALVKENRLGAAQLLSQAAQAQHLPYRQELALAASDLAAAHPGWESWGGGEPRLEALFGQTSSGQARVMGPLTPALSPSEGERGASPTGRANPGADSEQVSSNKLTGAVRIGQPLTEWLVRSENRDATFRLLAGSQNPAVEQLLRCRDLTNTSIFSASQSAAGQALDAALALCGLLISEGQPSANLSNAVHSAASAANGGAGSQPLEEILLDMLSLGQRFNWCQLAVFARRIDDTETLRRLSAFVRQADNEGRLTELFAVVVVSGKPAPVAKYLSDFSETGLADTAASLRFGAGGLNELLKRDARLFVSGPRQWIAGFSPFGQIVDFTADYCWRKPGLSLILKWILYLLGGFWIAAGLHYSRPAVSVLERPLQVRGFHFAREALFGLGFLAVVLLASEPFLAQETQKELPFRLRLPSAGSVAVAGNAGLRTSTMNNVSILTLLLFFVLQALIYTACLVKLAEIRRQRVLPRVKLKLLENEEHLFDAGLYLGFAGTIISLILVSLGITKFSLMAAYSSTACGIVFVSIFKIFHLRTERRRLLLEAETQTPEAPAPALGQRFVAAS